MAYIGNARTLLLFAANVRDDIVPAYNDAAKIWPEDGPFDKTTFELSQEVPGGYEQNITVLRQQYKQEVLVTDTRLISTEILANNIIKLTCADIALAASLAAIQEPQDGFDDTYTLTISGSAHTGNNNTFVISDLIYDGQKIEIFLIGFGPEQSSVDETLSVSYGHYGYWEVLDGEADYTIGGTNDRYNRLIQFSEAPQAFDKIYVLHRGDATYNFVPSPNSVGPDQLQHNLRNFVCDRYVGSLKPDGVTLNATFALSQSVVNSKSILVTKNGVTQEGDDSDANYTDGDWALDSGVNTNGEQTITFKTPPSVGDKIQILHLGFSTISRREALSPGQVTGLPNGSVTTSKLATGAVTTEKIANGAITSEKFSNNTITGTKILLNHGEALRSKQSNETSITELIKLESDATTIDTPTTTSLKIASVKKINLSASNLSPETSDDISLGTTSKKFKDLHLTGTVNTAQASVSGNITVGGTVDGVDISSMKQTLDALVAQLGQLERRVLPIGTIMLSATPSAPDATWLVCDGSAVSRQEYNLLFAQIGTAFGVGNGTDTFNLPDLRRRCPVGKADADSLGGNEGVSIANRTLTHTHTGAAHTHDLQNHTHTVKKHYHGMGTGADLRIATSGGHTTTINISHTHPNSTANNAPAKITQTQSKATSISSSITVSDPGHAHSFIRSGRGGSRRPTDATTSSTQAVRGLSNTSHVHDQGSGANGSHAISSAPETTGGAQTATGDFSISLSREGTGMSVVHNFSDPGHFHSITDSGHGHTVTVGSVPAGEQSKSNTDGTHAHPATSFSGSIGELTGGENGNTDVASGTPSNNNTGSANYGTNVSGASSSPYLILNYIIKAR